MVEFAKIFKLKMLNNLSNIIFIKHTIFTVSIISFFTLAGYLHSQDVLVNSVGVLDSSGRERLSFSNTELITLKIDCMVNNPVDRVEFKFYIYDPTGRRVFYHQGNSMVGLKGYGGSEYRNLPLTFYTLPGEYKFTGEAIPVTGGIPGSSSTKELKFKLYSAVITLTYPVNGSKDITDQPLIFKWISSGATKYRFYLDDDPSFYNTLFVTGDGTDYPDVYETQYQYPQNPVQERQRLASDTVYYWKVEGLDINGNVVAKTAFPFNFTIKNTVTTSRDLSIENIKMEDINFINNTVKFAVILRNSGNEVISNVNVNFGISGLSTILLKTVSSIRAGENIYVDFDLNLEYIKGDSVVATSTVDVYDDNPKNNTLSKKIRIFTEKPRISGKVVVVDEKGKTPVKDAVIAFAGPVNGSVKTADKGEYVIGDLELGDYEITVKVEGYESPEPKKIKITKPVPYNNIDFELKPVPKEIVEFKEKYYSLIDAWEVLKKLLPKDVVGQFSGFSPTTIEMIQQGDVQSLIKELDEGRAKIISYKIVEKK